MRDSAASGPLGTGQKAPTERSDCTETRFAANGTFRTAPKLNLLPLGEANRTKTRFAANTAGAPDVFPDVGPYSVAEFLPVPSGRPPPLGPSAFSALPLLHCSMRAPGLREHSSNATPAHPLRRRRTPRTPCCRGRGPCGTRAARSVSHVRAQSPPMHAVPPTSKTVHIPTTRVRPRASPK